MRWWYFGALAATMLAGCSQVTTTTEIHEDGSFKRTVAVDYSDSGMGSGETEVSPKDALKQMLTLPEGAPWKTTWTDNAENGGVQFSATREYGVDETPVPDLIHTENGKELMKNSISVKKGEDGTYEYREKMIWTGPRSQDKMNTALKDDLLEALGDKKSAVTDAEIEKFSKASERGFIRWMFGPNDPMIFSLMAQPGLAERKLNVVLGSSLLDAAKEAFGDKLTEAERKTLVKKLLSKEAMESTGKELTNSGENQNSQMVNFTIQVQMPGTVTETNGILDPITNTVFWGFLKESVEFEDLELYAKSKLN